MATRKQAKSSKSRNPGGRPREYSEQMLIDAAIQVLLRDGYPTLTLRSLAAELGVSHTALYTYVKSVREIEDKAKRQLTERLPRPHSTSNLELRKEFIAFLRSIQRIYVAHPGAVFSGTQTEESDIFQGIGDAWKKALIPFAPDAETLDLALSAMVGAVLLLVEVERAMKKQAGQKTGGAEKGKSSPELPTDEAIEQYLSKLLNLVLPGLSVTGSDVKSSGRRRKK